MGIIKKIRYNCRHATFLIEKKQHTSLRIRERIELMIHLSGCSVCRLFQQQSRWIDRMVRGLFHSAKTTDSRLNDEFKREMQEKINERLK